MFKLFYFEGLLLPRKDTIWNETSSALTASSGLQTIEEEELVTSLKVEVELVPGGFTGTPEIEEEGVESSDLSERGKKKLIL